jgi:hypothetical protein
MNLRPHTTNPAPSSRQHHLGVEFVIWCRENSWFWFLVDPPSQKGVIGATADEGRAMREARLSIEEIVRSVGRGTRTELRTPTPL